MKAKKPAAKTVKKAAKPAPRKPAPAKGAAKPKAAAKPVAKKSSKPSKVLAAAGNKLKSLFTGSKKPVAKVATRKPAAKPLAKPVAKAAAARPAAPAPAKVTQKPFVSKLVPPKGLVSEAQIRRMSDKDYMNDTQLEFFRHRLLQMREEVLTREVDVKERLHQREIFADPADRATAEEEHWLDLRLRERESLLLRKIDEALRRIAEREFGYCEKTGDPIGIPRLLARPTATVCVDVKGQDERVEAQFRDR